MEEADRRQAESTIVEAVAHNNAFDNLTRERLADTLQASIPDFEGKSFFRIFDDKRIIEVMAGWGRNVPVLKKFNPSEIILVDICNKSINEA